MTGGESPWNTAGPSHRPRGPTYQV
jgi:hypothetical protein